MRLLFDENLSHRLVDALSDEFPGSTHVRELGLEAAEDRAVWDYAARNDYLIVSKDSDFRQLSFLLGSPPKVIWVRMGNVTTSAIEDLLRRSQDAISSFHADSPSAFLILG